MTRFRKIFSYLLLLPAVLPLIYIGGVMYPYITPKTFLLQSVGIIALALFTYLALAGQVFFYKRLRAPATWIPALLLLVAYIASFFGLDFYRSFWGIFGRGDGLLTLTAITTFFYLILISIDSEFFDRLIKTIAIVAGAVAAIAVLQWAQMLFSAKVSFLPPVTGRIGSTFGNAAFLSGYLGMALFVILIALRDSVGHWRRFFQIAATLSILAIIFSATRGTIIALICSGIAVLIFVALKGSEDARYLARCGLIILAIVFSLFFVFRGNLSQSSFEPIRRLASISFSDATVSSRLFIWSNIAEEALQKPFLGYGAENVTRLFDKIYDPSKIIEQWFDRSHNAFLDYFVQYGIFGLALYLSLIAVFAITAVEASSLSFFLLALTYAIQNFFVFDTPYSFWLLYALLASLLAWQSSAQASNLTHARIPSFVSWAMSGFAVLLLIPTVILPLYANILFTRGYLFHVIEVNKANAYFEKGLSLGTYADLEYGYQAYDMYTAHQAANLTGQDRVSAYQFALSVLTANFEKYPYDARTTTYLGHVIDMAPPEVKVDDAFDEQVLNHAIELSPLRAQAWYMLANISLRNADYLKAIQVLEEYAQKEPSLSVPRYTLATLYYKLGDAEKAKKLADEALSLYTEPDIAAAGPAVKYYIATKDWEHAIRFLEDLASDKPDDYNILYDLAKVTYMAGDPATAERIVSQLRRSNPAILETDKNFLKAITAYEQSKK